MNVPGETLKDHLSEISTLGLVALAEMLNPGERDAASVGDLLPDPRATDPVAELEVDETRRALTDSINRLAERERLVVTLYYYEGLTLAEIGDVLGVTESRVCQIHTKAVMSVKNRMIEPIYRGK